MAKLIKIFIPTFVFSILLFAYLVFFTTPTNKTVVSYENSYPVQLDSAKKDVSVNSGISKEIENAKTDDFKMTVIITNLLIAKNYLNQYFQYPQK